MEYPHWKYFIALDSELEIVSRYVEISQENYKTYSIQFVSLLLSACSEIDVVAKVLSRLIDPDFRPARGSFPTIIDYQNTITEKFPKFQTTKIQTPRHGIELVPWKDWEAQNTSPPWWTSYNRVKHQRDSFYKDANLENTMNAVAGLFVMVLYLYTFDERLNIEHIPAPKFFAVDQLYETGTRWANTVYYTTPDQLADATM